MRLKEGIPSKQNSDEIVSNMECIRDVLAHIGQNLTCNYNDAMKFRRYDYLFRRSLKCT